MKLTALKRIELLSEKDSLEMFFPDLSSGYISGKCIINGYRAIICVSNTELKEDIDLCDSMDHFIKALETALEMMVPFVLFMDNPSLTSEGKGQYTIHPDMLLAGKRGVGRLYYMHSRLSGEVPRITILGGNIGAALSFPVALSDIAILVSGSTMCLGNPVIVKQMIGEEVSLEDLAGASMHCSVSGTGDALAINDDEAIFLAKKYLSYFPLNRNTKPPLSESKAPEYEERTIQIPKDPNQPFDMKRFIKSFTDSKSFIEIKEQFAPEIITCFARVNGMPFGLVASNSKYKGGILFPESCNKMSRFISICDSFGLPLVFLADLPGFMVGSKTEKSGSIKSGALLFSTIEQTTVPKLSIAARKAYTAGLYAMSGPGFSPEKFLALPNASISIFGNKLLEFIINSEEISTAEKEAFSEMLAESTNPILLAEKNLIDEIITQKDLRNKISSFLKKSLKYKREKRRRPILLL